ncbi:Uncharacterised protein [Mycobacteroides abscessus subsp. abscessus]|nr:Uncharacterised protein [Mycobacteroides abscessus subsp. abscessus]
MGIDGDGTDGCGHAEEEPFGVEVLGGEARRDPHLVDVGRDEEREVEVPGLEAGDELRVLVHRHVERRPEPRGVLVPARSLLQLVVEFGDDAGADGRNGSDLHRHRLGVAPQADLVDEAVAESEDLDAAGDDEGADSRRVRSARGALDERGSERSLEVAEVMVDRGLAPAER